MSIEVYEKMLEVNEIDTDITKAEAEYMSGAELLNGREALSKLRMKYFG